MPGEESCANTIDGVRAERDLYQHLLELGNHDELESFVESSLNRVVQIAGARRGYLEVRTALGDEPGDIVSFASPPQDAADLRAVVSTGVMTAALSAGQTIVTDSALVDARFSERSSVRRNRIEAVICAPIGSEPSVGVVYLQDRIDGGTFTDGDKKRVELFARSIARFAERLLLRRRVLETADPTQRYRQSLNIASIVGRSQALAKVLSQVALVVANEVTVLLSGPTGTGKTQLARVIHANGPRCSHPFIELNCATLPETLVESELFGATAGAHSTAINAAEGKVAAAEAGTLFLDEVGELAPPAQAKLLQLLQSGTYYPLGSNKLRKADVRLIAATNIDLKEAVANKTFREDLYYRLSVLPIRLPALSERTEDVPLLAAHCAHRAAERSRIPPLPLSPGAIITAETSDWPGNIRQLANAIEAALLRAAGDGADQIEAHHIFPDAERNDDSAPATFQQQVHQFKRQLLARTLEQADWNVSEAARRLDIARTQAHKLIRAFGLERAT